MVTIQFVFRSPLVTEARSEEKVKTHGWGQSDRRTTKHCKERENGRERRWRRKATRKNWCEEMVLINVCNHRLGSIMYNLHCMEAKTPLAEHHQTLCIWTVSPSSRFVAFVTHANQGTHAVYPKTSFEFLEPNVFILNIPGKLLHQRQTMSTETGCPLKFPAVKQDFNYIMTFKLYLHNKRCGLSYMRGRPGKVGHTFANKLLEQVRQKES